MDEPINFKDILRTIEVGFGTNLRTTEALTGLTGPYKKSVCNLLLESLGAETKENPTVKEFLEYLVATWIPDWLQIRPKSVRFHPDMTSMLCW